MTRAKSFMLVILGLLALPGCQQQPTSAQESRDQQRFMTGCRSTDAARDPTAFVAYCDRF